MIPLKALVAMKRQLALSHIEVTKKQFGLETPPLFNPYPSLEHHNQLKDVCYLVAILVLGLN